VETRFKTRPLEGKGTQLAPRARYSGTGGQLAPLPHSKWETAWVADAFRKPGNPVLSLAGPSGRRRILDFGRDLLLELERNFYSALALTPGRNRNLADYWAPFVLVGPN
jgi:hypothetical protein